MDGMTAKVSSPPPRVHKDAHALGLPPRRLHVAPTTPTTHARGRCPRRACLLALGQRPGQVGAPPGVHLLVVALREEQPPALAQSPLGQELCSAALELHPNDVVRSAPLRRNPAQQLLALHERVESLLLFGRESFGFHLLRDLRVRQLDPALRVIP